MEVPTLLAVVIVVVGKAAVTVAMVTEVPLVLVMLLATEIPVMLVVAAVLALVLLKVLLKVHLNGPLKAFVLSVEG